MNPTFVLLTGASSGMGKATTQLLADSGYKVIAGVRREASLDELEALDHPHIIPIQLDVTCPDHITRASAEIARITSNLGLGALINNAGNNYISTTEHACEHTARELLDTHFWGTANLTRAMTPLLRLHASQHKHGARIINVGSIGSITAMPFIQYYNAAKFALLGFSESLRFELMPLNIRTSILIVGSVDTSIWDKTDTHMQRALDDIPDTQQVLHHNLSLMNQVSRRIKQHAISSHEAAFAYKRVLESASPRFKYYVGRDAWLANLMHRILPTRTRHYLTQKMLGFIEHAEAQR